MEYCERMEYHEDECLVVARFFDDIQQKFGFGQQHTLEKGLKKLVTKVSLLRKKR